MGDLDVYQEPQISRRQLIQYGSTGLLLALTTTSCSYSDQQVKTSAKPQVADDSLVADALNAAGSTLAFLGAAGTAIGTRGLSTFPSPTLTVASTAIALIGGLCSAIGSNISLTRHLHPQDPLLPPQYFGLGEGIGGQQIEHLSEYAQAHGWKVVSQRGQMSGGFISLLAAFQDSVTSVGSGVGTSPVFIATNKMGLPVMFQLASQVHIEREGSGDLVINEAGYAYIMGYMNKVYLCRIKTLRYLLEDDKCSWFVLSGTEEVGVCKDCGARLYYQEFTNGQKNNGVLMKKAYKFSPNADPKWSLHRAHSVVDDICNPVIRCKDSSY